MGVYIHNVITCEITLQAATTASPVCRIAIPYPTMELLAALERSMYIVPTRLNNAPIYMNSDYISHDNKSIA
jgi:hypothetical protein